MSNHSDQESERPSNCIIAGMRLTETPHSLTIRASRQFVLIGTATTFACGAMFGGLSFYMFYNLYLDSEKVSVNDGLVAMSWWIGFVGACSFTSMTVGCMFLAVRLIVLVRIPITLDRRADTVEWGSKVVGRFTDIAQVRLAVPSQPDETAHPRLHLLPGNRQWPPLEVRGAVDGTSGNDLTTLGRKLASYIGVPFSEIVTYWPEQVSDE